MRHARISLIFFGVFTIHISKISLSNFRNYKELELELPKGTTIIQGDNGHGKSNLLEAAYMLSKQVDQQLGKLEIFKGYLPFVVRDRRVGRVLLG